LPGTSIQFSYAKKTGAIRGTSVRQMEAVDPRRKASRQVTGFRRRATITRIQAVLSATASISAGQRSRPALSKCRDISNVRTLKHSTYVRDMTAFRHPEMVTIVTFPGELLRLTASSQDQKHPSPLALPADPLHSRYVERRVA